MTQALLASNQPHSSTLHAFSHAGVPISDNHNSHGLNGLSPATGSGGAVGARGGRRKVFESPKLADRDTGNANDSSSGAHLVHLTAHQSSRTFVEQGAEVGTVIGDIGSEGSEVRIAAVQHSLKRMEEATKLAQANVQTSGRHHAAANSVHRTVVLAAPTSRYGTNCQISLFPCLPSYFCLLPVTRVVLPSHHLHRRLSMVFRANRKIRIITYCRKSPHSMLLDPICLHL